MNRVFSLVVSGALTMVFLCGCMSSAQPSAATEPVTITLAAAASLELSFREELIPLFEEKHPNIKVEAVYDSSGKLQTQIKEGLEADVFLSAAEKQMNALVAQGLVERESVVPLLENKLVLIAPAGSAPGAGSFERAHEAGRVALGDPDSVPAGQYAREIFVALGNWDAILARASLGSNVTEVLNWVAEGSADLGVVYATDAASGNKVNVLAQAPEGALKTPVIYPVGALAASGHANEATLFVEFLRSPEALAIFEARGFSAAKE